MGVVPQCTPGERAQELAGTVTHCSWVFWQALPAQLGSAASTFCLARLNKMYKPGTKARPNMEVN